MEFTARTQRRTVLLLAAASLACAPAGPPGEVVDIAEESAIILWDPAAKTQHFIRRASFETKAKDFGFLVPTPTAPKLAEADDAAFHHLDAISRPPVLRFVEAAKATAVQKGDVPKPAVLVIERVKVAGYDAAVLEANDAGALDEWLKKNGYASTPELIAWTEHYIEKRWIITAFKIAADKPGLRIDGSAVRMTFTTDRPFFPYREPTTTNLDNRLLTIYFLGDSRPEGKIGADTAWPGRVAWSDTISDSDRDQLAKYLKLPDPLPNGLRRLTRFSDGSSQRPGRDDLFFSAGADQSVAPDPKAMRALEKLMIAKQEADERDAAIGYALLALLLVAGIFTCFRYFRKK